MTTLQEKRNAIFTEMNSLMETANKETRAFTAEEDTRFEQLNKEIHALDKQLERNKEFRSLSIDNANTDTSPTAEKEIRSFELYLKSQVLGDKSLETRADITYGANGAVIPKTIVNKIIDEVVNISPLFANATKYYLKGEIAIPKVNTSDGNGGTEDITVGFADEFSTLNGHGINFSNITLKGFLAAALTVVSRKLINNSQFDIVSFVVNRMAQKVAIFVENYLINGGTSSTAGGTSSGLTNGVTQTVNITSGGSITSDFLIDVQDTIPDVYQKNAFWLMSPKTRTIIRKLKDGQSNYLLVKDFSSPTGYTLLGKPVYISDNIKGFAQASAGDDFLYYGDFSGLAVKVAEDANIQVLNEVYATKHAVGLVLWMEIDNIVENPQKLVKASLVAAGNE